MRIQGFIFNWVGYESKALQLEKKIDRHIDIHVVNSDASLVDKYPHWIHLDDSAYFSAQWNRALEIFNADIFFHIQADADYDRFEILIEKAESLFKKHRLGIYEPNVDYTDVMYDISKLAPIETNVYETPLSDCTCWFIAGEVLRRFSPIDVSVNKYGWGVTRVTSSLCRMDDRLCVRDYNVTVNHPKGRGYSSSAAMRQLEQYVLSLSPEIRREIYKLEQHRV